MPHLSFLFLSVLLFYFISFPTICTNGNFLWHRFKAYPSRDSCGQTWASFPVLTRGWRQTCYINIGPQLLSYLLLQPQASITMSSQGRGILTLLATCNNKVRPTAVWSCSKARTTAAVFRKKHLKDIRRLGSDFKWKLNQGVKRHWLCSGSHYSLLLGVWFYLRVTGSKRQWSCEDHPCKHNLWWRQVVGETMLRGLLCQVQDCKPDPEMW